MAALAHPAPALAQSNTPDTLRTAPIEGDVAAAPLSERELANLTAFTRIYTVARWFHPSDAALSADWDALAVEAVPAVTSAESPQALAGALEEIFAPLIEDFEVSAELLAPKAEQSGAGVRWRWWHQGFAGINSRSYSRTRYQHPSLGPGPIFAESLPGGVHVRFPLTAAVAGDGTPESEAKSHYAGKPEGWTPSGFDRDTRIAATLIAWGVFDQFYPYWEEIEVDWDAVLTEQLKSAATAGDDKEFRDALRMMAFALKDGHAGVGYDNPAFGTAPLALERVEGQFVAVWADPTSGIARGDIITAIDGVPLAEEFEQLLNGFSSGSEQWRTRRALDRLALGAPESTAQVSFTDAEGAQRTAELARVPYSWQTRPQAKRIDPIVELEPGILYFDITRTDRATMLAAAEQLIAARGIVFDLRGRPANTNFLLSHLTDVPIESPNFRSMIIQRPDQAHVTYKDNPWQLLPQTPRLTQNVVFLMDERAISYPESWLGTIKGNGLGTLVGSPSAGGNGDITWFAVPGGYRLVFSGLKVRNLDGSVDHAVGIQPDVPVSLTVEGIREGRDEILEAGLAEVRRGMAAP